MEGIGDVAEGGDLPKGGPSLTVKSLDQFRLIAMASRLPGCVRWFDDEVFAFPLPTSGIEYRAYLVENWAGDTTHETIAVAGFRVMVVAGSKTRPAELVETVEQVGRRLAEHVNAVRA